MEAIIKREPRFILQSLTLLAAGFLVTFTPTLHDNLAFNSWLVTGFGAAFALVSLIYFVGRPKSSIRFVYAVSAVAAIGLAVAALMVTSAAGLRLAFIVWAAVGAATHGYAWVLKKSRRQLSIALFLTGFVLLMALLVVSLPAVMGFFAAFSIVAGVFIGIAAFDPQENNLPKTSENTRVAL